MEKCRKTRGNKLTITPDVKVETVDKDDGDDSNFIPYEDNKTSPRYIPPKEVTDKDGGYLGLDNITDQIISIEVMFYQGERMHQPTGKFIGRCLDRNGIPIGTPQ